MIIRLRTVIWLPTVVRVLRVLALHSETWGRVSLVEWGWSEDVADDDDTVDDTWSGGENNGSS